MGKILLGLGSIFTAVFMLYKSVESFIAVELGAAGGYFIACMLFGFVGMMLFTVVKAYGITPQNKVENNPHRLLNDDEVEIRLNALGHSSKDVPISKIKTPPIAEPTSEDLNSINYDIPLTEKDFNLKIEEMDRYIDIANRYVVAYKAELELKWNNATFEKCKKFAQDAVDLNNKKVALLKSRVSQLEQLEQLEKPDQQKTDIPIDFPDSIDDSRNKEYEEEKSRDIVSVFPQKLSTMKALREFRNYVVIDFETTGFSAKTDKAIEVACLKVIDGESYEYQTLIDPKIHISSRITKINGITDSDVVGFPSIVEVASRLYDFCDGLPFVAHNAPFDMGFLKQAYIEVGLETNLLYVDTLKLARSAFPEYNTHKLEFLIKELDLAEKQTHRAMDDVRCTKKLLDICISKIIEQKEVAKQSRKQALLNN